MNNQKPLQTLVKVVFCLLVTAGQAIAQESVQVHLNARHEVGGISTFDRETYITLHASIDDNEWDSDAQRAQFLTDYDVYLGRDNGRLPWHLTQTTEDPSMAGWPNHASLQSRGANARSNYASETAAHPLEFRNSKMMIGGQMKMYPNGQTNGNGWAVADYDALGDYFANFLTHFFGTGGTTGEPKPAMVEVVNEPFVAASKYGTTRANISQMHNVVASHIKTLHPDVLVGGYTAAHPAYENGNFSHWNNNWKLFIDTAGANMDFFSLHLYDHTPDPSNKANVKYRSGSNVEAILDMVEHYSFLQLGEVKPFNISEYGSLEALGPLPYTREDDWANLRSFSTMLMQLLERPDVMIQTMPFHILKAEWGRDAATGNPYGSRLLRQEFEVPGETGNDWVYTELIKFYQLWAEVNGTRVDTIASDPDIQVDAYVDGANAYLILNNLHHDTTQAVDLNLFGHSGNPILDIEVKHLFADATGLPTLDVYTPNTLTQVTLDKAATMILHYTFTDPIVLNEASTEAKYYAETYLQSISAGVPRVFNINSVSNIAAHGEVVLRLGLGRAHGKSLQPTVLFNGTFINVPTDWRGYDQANRDQFFGVIEISVPHNLLLTNNTVSVQFGDSGGHISSVAMQVFSFTTDLRNPALFYPLTLSAQVLLPDLVISVTDGPSNGYFSLLSTSNLLDATWTTNQGPLPLSGAGTASLIQPLPTEQQFYRAVVSGPPPVPVSGISVFPGSDTVSSGGGGCRLLGAVIPADATNTGILWSSSNVGVATVSTDGVVTGGSAGTAVITGTTDDGGFVAQSTITVGSSTAKIRFDDAGYYRDLEVEAGSMLDVICTYDAGAGNTRSGGVKYWLREVTSTWQVVNDYTVHDNGGTGTQSGGSAASIPVPSGITLTAALPAGNFYFLFLTFDASDGSSHNVGVNPIIIVPPVP